MTLGRGYIFILLSLPVYKYDMSLHQVFDFFHQYFAIYLTSCYLAEVTCLFLHCFDKIVAISFLLNFIEEQLLYNTVLVSAAQRSEPAICSIHIFHIFGFLSHFGHYRTLSQAHCAVPQVLISYLFYIQYQQCICVNPNLPVHPNPFPSPVTPLFSTFVLYFCFANKIIHTIFLDSTYRR